MSSTGLGASSSTARPAVPVDDHACRARDARPQPSPPAAPDTGTAGNTDAFASLTPGSEQFAQLAHEMRGPLMALTTSAELLTEEVDVLDRAQIRQMAQGIQARALWLQGLVENVLCAAAVRAGRFRIQPQRVSLVDVVDEVRLLLEPLLMQRGQAFRLHLRHVLGGARQAEVEVVADGRRIGQVLVNLILNASKYAPRSTPVDVTVSARGAWLRVSVADRGPGLPAGGGEALFQPYHRGVYDDPPPAGAADEPAVAGATAPAPEGLGLGLAIARTIVAAHGGRIGARSRTGGGSVFWFDLPAASGSGEAT